MVVPKKKRSRKLRGDGRAHYFLVPKGWTVCKETGEFVAPHRVSPLGWYKGKKVLKTKADKREAKADSKA